MLSQQLGVSTVQPEVFAEISFKHLDEDIRLHTRKEPEYRPAF
jgi:hypothetical protein